MCVCVCGLLCVCGCVYVCVCDCVIVCVCVCVCCCCVSCVFLLKPDKIRIAHIGLCVFVCVFIKKKGRKNAKIEKK